MQDFERERTSPCLSPPCIFYYAFATLKKSLKTRPHFSTCFDFEMTTLLHNMFLDLQPSLIIAHPYIDFHCTIRRMIFVDFTLGGLSLFCFQGQQSTYICTFCMIEVRQFLPLLMQLQLARLSIKKVCVEADKRNTLLEVNISGKLFPPSGGHVFSEGQ